MTSTYTSIYDHIYYYGHIHLSIHQIICQPIYPSIRPSIDLTIHQSIYSSSPLSLHLQLNDLRRQQACIFIVATNRLRSFDAAVTRPGRFDLLLFVGTPNLQVQY